MDDNIKTTLSKADLANSINGETMYTQHYFDRDLSWMEFNRRVLFQAQDRRNPLLERVKFLGIFSSNLDEFFMKRVGYLKRVLGQNRQLIGHQGLPLQKILLGVQEQIRQQTQEQNDIFRNAIVPELELHGIELLKWVQLDPAAKAQLRAYFRTKVFPILTPLAVDPAHPFPFLSNMSVSLGIKLRMPHHDTKTTSAPAGGSNFSNGQMLFARIKIPDMLPQWIRVEQEKGSSSMRFIRLVDLIEHNLSDLFPDMVIEGVTPFRVIRNAAIGQVDDEDAEDLTDIVEEELRLRRLARVVCLQHRHLSDPWILNLLQEELELASDDFFETNGELDYRTLYSIAALPIPSLKFKSFVPATPKRLADESRDMFSLIREGDLLVHHPYESFTGSVEKFVRQAVSDELVMAIKMTVYRIGELSPFIPLLIQAAEEGKQVVCVVEVKARFDEARNLSWAEKLEKAGVHVVYGVVDLKTHTKNTLIVRKEGDDFRFYAHFGTGNYNVETAKLYTDLGLFTCHSQLTRELVEVFNYLTGLSLKKNYKKLLVAPINLRERLVELIRRETSHAQNGQPARIIAKMNSLEDKQICQELYAASEAGVSIDLIVRGFCCLRPGVAGMSENIRVTSIVGRFLEHSRLFYFKAGAKNFESGDFFISSADWMYRNLSQRVETMIPILDKKLKKECADVLNILLNDNCQQWQLQPDGRYILNRPSLHGSIDSSGTPILSKKTTPLQQKLMRTGSHSTIQRVFTDSFDFEECSAQSQLLKRFSKIHFKL